MNNKDNYTYDDGNKDILLAMIILISLATLTTKKNMAILHRGYGNCLKYFLRK